MRQVGHCSPGKQSSQPRRLPDGHGGVREQVQCGDGDGGGDGGGSGLPGRGELGLPAPRPLPGLSHSGGRAVLRPVSVPGGGEGAGRAAGVPGEDAELAGGARPRSRRAVRRGRPGRVRYVQRQRFHTAKYPTSTHFKQFKRWQ